MDTLEDWNCKDSKDKTYQKFKTHIWKEYNELRKVGALTIQHSKLQPQMQHAQMTPNQGILPQDITNELRNTIMDAIMAMNDSDASSDSTIPLAPQWWTQTLLN